MYKCVLGIHAAALRVTIIQPAFKEAIVKLYHKQKLPCLYEEDDIFFQLQINQLIQKSTTNRAVEHYARVPTL